MAYRIIVLCLIVEFVAICSGQELLESSKAEITLTDSTATVKCNQPVTFGLATTVKFKQTYPGRRLTFLCSVQDDSQELDHFASKTIFVNADELTKTISNPYFAMWTYSKSGTYEVWGTIKLCFADNFHVISIFESERLQVTVECGAPIVDAICEKGDAPQNVDLVASTTAMAPDTIRAGENVKFEYWSNARVFNPNDEPMELTILCRFSGSIIDPPEKEKEQEFKVSIPPRCNSENIMKHCVCNVALPDTIPHSVTITMEASFTLDDATERVEINAKEKMYIDGSLI